MSEYAKIKGDDTLKRDIRTGVLVSSNEDLMNYRKLKAELLKDRDRDNTIRSLQSDVTELKQLLKELINKM